MPCSSTLNTRVVVSSVETLRDLQANITFSPRRRMGFSAPNSVPACCASISQSLAAPDPGKAMKSRRAGPGSAGGGGWSAAGPAILRMMASARPARALWTLCLQRGIPGMSVHNVKSNAASEKLPAVSSKAFTEEYGTLLYRICHGSVHSITRKRSDVPTRSSYLLGLKAMWTASPSGRTRARLSSSSTRWRSTCSVVFAKYL
mmetsp:Transcript_106633/g.301725  ORF Transcript_106633/g.301725 Transcript_106633/m.301725 type:complete len:203 (+) Transcript_106633:199-807(+)